MTSSKRPVFLGGCGFSREMFSFRRMLVLPQPGLLVGFPSRLTENCRQNVGTVSRCAFQDSWKAPRETVPTFCRQFSVSRDGKPTNKPGCGSTNIRRKENISRENPQPPKNTGLLEDVISGAAAYPSGIQLRPQ